MGQSLPLLPEQFHGRGGPMQVEAMIHKPSLKYWLAAAEELGYQTSADPNAIQMQGIQFIKCRMYFKI